MVEYTNDFLYFPEYITYNSRGDELKVYFDTRYNCWWIGGVRASVNDLGKRFDLDEDELLMLKLTYG